MIETKKDAQTVAEFLSVPTERIDELSKKYEGTGIFEILDDALHNEEYSTNERLAIWFQVGFNFGQNVLMAETQRQVAAETAKLGGLEVH
jgi:hypothetical protein